MAATLADLPLAADKWDALRRIHAASGVSGGVVAGGIRGGRLRPALRLLGDSVRELDAYFALDLGVRRGVAAAIASGRLNRHFREAARVRG